MRLRCYVVTTMLGLMMNVAYADTTVLQNQVNIQNAKYMNTIDEAADVPQNQSAQTSSEGVRIGETYQQFMERTHGQPQSQLKRQQ